VAPDEEAENTLPPGTLLGRYQIRRLLGRGGMGCVYEGTHTELKKRVAIKTLHPSVAALPGARARFMREGEAASRIRHPNVVDVTDVGTESGITFLVMEFLEGEDLFGLLGRQRVLPVTEALDYLLPVFGAIAAAHDEGVIHRDLKPANIFLARTRHAGVQPMVLDFGISKVSGSGTGQTLALTGAGASLGTPCYIAPEQIRGVSDVTARSDQYALGTILYECLTGRRAHDGDTVFAILHSVGSGTFPAPRTIRADLPPELEKAILRAMQLDPANRFPTLRGFGRALLPFASPAIRAQWTPLFAEAGEAVAPVVSGARAGLASGGTMVLPPELGGPAAPPTGRGEAAGSSTTLGAAASAVVARRGRVQGKVVGAVALVAVAAAAIVVVATRSAERPRTDLAASGSSAAPTSAPTSPIAATPPPSPAARYRANGSATPEEAELVLDGVKVGRGDLAREFAVNGVEHTLIVSAPGFEPTTVKFRDQPPPEEVKLTRVDAPGTADRGERHDRQAAPSHEEGSAKKHPERPASKHPRRSDSRTGNDAPIID
jgi:tRNA A-37 threonylcarbamoyl transferase component Bud32